MWSYKTHLLIRCPSTIATRWFQDCVGYGIPSHLSQSWDMNPAKSFSIFSFTTDSSHIFSPSSFPCITFANFLSTWIPSILFLFSPLLLFSSRFLIPFKCAQSCSLQKLNVITNLDSRKCIYISFRTMQG